MHQVINFNYNVLEKRWSFLVNGSNSSNLINASQYDDQPNQYRYCEPFINEENERFVLLGDGNLVTIVDGLTQEIAYKIMQNVKTFNTYVILSAMFSAEFEIVNNDNLIGQ